MPSAAAISSWLEAFQLAHHDRRPLRLGQRLQPLASGPAISSRRSASPRRSRPPAIASASSSAAGGWSRRSLSAVLRTIR